MIAMAYASLDRILNWTVGTEFLDGFFTDSPSSYKQGGYPAVTEDSILGPLSYYPRYLNSDQTIEASDWQYYVDNDRTDWLNSTNDGVYGGTFYGQKQKMDFYDEVNVLIGSDKVKAGTLSYNVPSMDDEQKTDDGYYVFYGPSIKDLDSGNSYKLNFFVPVWEEPEDPSDDTFWTQTEPTKTSNSALLWTSPVQQHGETFTWTSDYQQDVSSYASIDRDFGVDLSLKYELKDVIEEGMDGLVSDTMTSDFVATANLDYSADSQNSNTYTQTAGGSGTTTYTNNTNPAHDIYIALYSNQTSYKAPYKLLGTLTYDIDDVGASRDKAVAYYQESGKKGNRTITNSVSSVLEATAESEISDSYEVAFGPDGSQVVSTSGMYTAQNQTSYSFWFYYIDRNGSECGTSEIDNLNSHSCSETTPADASNSRAVEPSYKKKPGKFTWKNLKDFHDSYVNDTYTIQQKVKGVKGKTDMTVGMSKSTSKGAYNIGTDHADYHYNQSSKKPGGAILHQGADQYHGNAKPDFVSSKTLGGVSSINTKGGKDRVYIDANHEFDDITRGYTDLGKGNDKFLWITFNLNQSLLAKVPTRSLSRGIPN